MKGILNPISCYCGNGGYLITADQKRIAICLKEAEIVNYLNIKIKGTFVNQSPPNEQTTPCPPETMTVFMVQDMECE